LGGHSIHQKVKGHSVVVYRFPAKLSVPRGSALTVWAQQSRASHRHHHHHHQQEQRSIEMECISVEKWLSDNHCTTVLCRPNGQVDKLYINY